MARQPIEIGSAGRRLAENLARLRENRRASYTELSTWLRRLGRSLSAETIGKIERRERRVDVDDLVALAIALDTTPNRLLLTGSADDTELVELTPEVKITALNAWMWANGEEPLPAGCAPPPMQIVLRDDRDRIFTRENQPYNRPEPYFRGVQNDLRDHAVVARMLAAVLEEAHERRMSVGAVTRLYEHLDTQRRFGELDGLLDSLSGSGNGASQPEQPIVAAIVISARGVLITARRDGNPPWGFVTGEVEPGEQPQDACWREVKEETGLEVRVSQLIGERDHPQTGRHVIYIAATPTQGLDIAVGDEAELAEVKWASLAEAEDLLPGMYRPVREYLAREIGEPS